MTRDNLNCRMVDIVNPENPRTMLVSLDEFVKKFHGGPLGALELLC